MEFRENDTKLFGKTFQLREKNDIIKIREFGRNLANKAGFRRCDQTLISTAISEICRNVLDYVDSGTVKVEIPDEQPTCIKISVKDEGSGIQNLNRALSKEFTANNGMSIGITEVKKVMDEFDIQTQVGKGTTIRMCKWLDKEGQR